MLKYANKARDNFCYLIFKASPFCSQTINDPHSNITFKICYPFPDDLGPFYPKIIVMLRFACYYAIPLFIIGIFYVLIAKHLIHSASHVPGEIQGAQRQVIKRLYRSSRYLISTSISSEQNSIKTFVWVQNEVSSFLLVPELCAIL